MIMHIAESQQIEPHDIPLLDRLLHNFVVRFSQLYGDRHCVQVVHSVAHIALQLCGTSARLRIIQPFNLRMI